MRLYAAAKQLANVEGQTALAALLHESPQAINNWESRGVSERGALKAQAILGCDANWLLTGAGAMLAGWPFPRVEPERYLAMSAEDRAWVQARLQQAIEECEAGAQNADPRQVLRQARVVLNKASEQKSKRTG